MKINADKLLDKMLDKLQQEIAEYNSITYTATQKIYIHQLSFITGLVAAIELACNCEIILPYDINNIDKERRYQLIKSIDVYQNDKLKESRKCLNL